uniref:Uncharacterized protein n=1 Tax=Rhizophora mucronata TaxID=61149 RepID=A0A2P2ISQ2_RHIMU
MDKGWGLTLNSDPVFTFLSSNVKPPPPPAAAAAAKMKREFDNNMVCSGGDSVRMFQFPLNLPSDGEERPGFGSVGELDFFSDKKSRANDADDDYRDGSKSNSVSTVKMENISRGEAARPKSSLDVNVRKIY